MNVTIEEDLKMPNFAAGVVRAVRFIADSRPGLYNMIDVLGLKP